MQFPTARKKRGFPARKLLWKIANIKSNKLLLKILRAPRQRTILLSTTTHWKKNTNQKKGKVCIFLSFVSWFCHLFGLHSPLHKPVCFTAIDVIVKKLQWNGRRVRRRVRPRQNKSSMTRARFASMEKWKNKRKVLNRNNFSHKMNFQNKQKTK